MALTASHDSAISTCRFSGKPQGIRHVLDRDARVRAIRQTAPVCDGNSSIHSVVGRRTLTVLAMKRLSHENSEMARLQQLPDCLVVGPQRAGTTWIHSYLESRGDVSLPLHVKETFFFDRSFDRGIAWYRRQFCGKPTALRVCEVAPTYFDSAEVAIRIQKVLGSIRIVCTLRDPVERIFSLYLHMRRYGMTRLSLRPAVTRHPELLGTSRYATHLRKWFEVFGRERVKVLYLETLQAEPARYANQLCRHFELPYNGLEDSLHGKINASALPFSATLARLSDRGAHRLRAIGCHGVIEFGKKLGLKKVLFGGSRIGQRLPTLSHADAIWLWQQVSEEVVALERLLDIDLAHWRPDGGKLGLTA